MILRLLIFILSAILFAYAVSVLSDVDERVFVEVFGVKLSAHAGFAIGALIVSATILVLTTSLAKDLMALPGKLRARRERAQLDRGMAALARGMEAVAIGDSSDAVHHARVAHRNLGDGSVTRLLTAQAAQLSGDDDTAGQSFEAMLEAPETEFLGLRGLYGKAMRAGDKDAARGYAERAYRLRPNASWAFDSVFDLALERGAWGDARDALGPAIKNKTIDAEKARRAEAALLAASAHSAEASGDVATALEEAELALRSAPGLAPAAALAARLHHRAGRTQRGVKILEQAFAAQSHGSLVAALLEILEDSAPNKAAEALRKLAARNPSAREASLARARAFILVGEHAAAIDALEPLLEVSASARDCALMAEAVGGAHGEPAARPWLERAAGAVRDPTPGADGHFRFTREGWAQLIRSYMDEEALAPAPLEGPPIGLAADEIRLLAAPPIAPSPGTPNTDETDDAPEATSPSTPERSDTEEPIDVVATPAPDPAAQPEPVKKGAAGEQGDSEPLTMAEVDAVDDPTPHGTPQTAGDAVASITATTGPGEDDKTDADADKDGADVDPTAPTSSGAKS
ncbi:MAG: heme biosynthesis HemY N-terminal domain-containing protein [Pseudomonadota bacterium]